LVPEMGSKSEEKWKGHISQKRKRSSSSKKNKREGRGKRGLRKILWIRGEIIQDTRDRLK